MAIIKFREKSKIAASVQNINILILVVILALMVIMSSLIITDIDNKNTSNLVRTFSIDAAQMFYSYISDDITLARKAANSGVIKEWFADEYNEEKKERAYREVMDYIGISPNAYLDIGIYGSLNEYRASKSAGYEDFNSFRTIDQGNLHDLWFFECINSENDYTLKIERKSQLWRLWINHKVTVDGKPAGVFCSGLEFPDIFQKLSSKYDTKKAKGYIINRFGLIQMNIDEFNHNIIDKSSDPAFYSAFSSYLKRINGIFINDSNSLLIRLSAGNYDYAVINPIEKTDWSVVLFYSSGKHESINNLLPLMVLMVTLLVMYAIFRNTVANKFIFLPLESLTKSVSKNKPEDLYGINRDDEIGELARTINDQAKQIREERERAQNANEAKTIFLANMSHEMRTPLNAVIGLSELTLEADDLPEDAYTNLEKINSAGATLLGTVNDILDISKIEAGKFELIPVYYDVPSVLNDAITHNIMRLESKPVEFILDISEDLPSRLYGDDLRIKQILNNLLSNAFKYTQSGTVKLGVYCSKPESKNRTVQLTIRVSDTGNGINEDDLQNLFADYIQADLLKNRKIEGTGLGLSITKRITEMMNGSISVQSEYGKGSVFTVIVQQEYTDCAPIGKDIVNALKSFNYIDQKRCRNSSLEKFDLSSARVLVVDDVVTNLEVAKGMLKPYGMKADCVTSGQEAIDIICTGDVKYDAIFMDHMMPGMDGIEAARRIREWEKERQHLFSSPCSPIPIIALTANAIIGSEKMFLDNGFQAFLSKPINISRLNAVVRQWIYNRNPVNVPESINIKKGIERFGGSRDVYFRILRSYADNTPVLLDKIRNVNQENLADYAVTVHGIKGASWGICAHHVGCSAEVLEKAAKNNDLDFVINNNPAFIAETETLVSDLKEMLLINSPDNRKPIREEPDKEILFRLSQSCEMYDMDGVDAAIAEIEKYEYTTAGALVERLKANAEKLNFMEIKEELEKLNGK